MKSTWLNIPFFLLLLMFFAAGISDLFGQVDLRTCSGFRCTSENVNVPRAYLSDANGNPIDISQINCNSTESQPVHISIEVLNNSNSIIYNTRLIADLSIGGTTFFQVNYFVGQVQGKGTARFTTSTSLNNWDCSSSIQLLNPGIYWTTSNNTDLSTSYTCSSYIASQCERPDDILVQVDLYSHFSADVSCPTTDGFLADFTSTVIGGIPGTSGYRYFWEFGETANPTTSTLANPEDVVFTSPGYVTLTVTDNSTPPMESRYVLFVSGLDIATSIFSPLSVNTSADGVISITVSGGFPPYSVSWTGPDGFTSTETTIDGIKEGTYTVTATDSRNCTVQKIFYMSDPITLPVTWLGFSGRWLDQQARASLDWSTAAEYNASFFEVERSANNGEDFRAITLIPAVGNSQTPSYYSFEDENMDPRVQRYYYRVKQTSGDGSFSYTRVLLMQRTQIQTIPLETWAAFPNPSSNNRLTLQLEGAGMSALDKKYQVTMYSALGHYKTEFKTLGNKIELDDFMGAVPKGLLIVEIRDEEGKMQILKVMKQ